MYLYNKLNFYTINHSNKFFIKNKNGGQTGNQAFLDYQNK